MEFIKSLITQFMVNFDRANYSACMHLAYQIIFMDTEKSGEKHIELLRKLDWIKKHTTLELNTNFYLITRYLSRLMVRRLSSIIEIKIDNRRHKEFEVSDLISEVEDAADEIYSIMRQIAKKYSIDIAIEQYGELEIPDLGTFGEEKTLEQEGLVPPGGSAEIT